MMRPRRYLKKHQTLDNFVFDDEPLPPLLQAVATFELAHRHEKNLFLLVARMCTRDDILNLTSDPDFDNRDYFIDNFLYRTFLEQDYKRIFNLPRDLFESRHARRTFYKEPFPMNEDIHHCIDSFIKYRDYLPWFGIIRWRWSKLKDCVGADHAHAAIKKFMEILERSLQKHTREYGTGVVVEFLEALYSYCKMLLPEYRLALAMGQHSRLGASSAIHTLPKEIVELIMNVNCPITNISFGIVDKV